MSKAKKQHPLDHKRRRFLCDSAAVGAGIAATAALPGLAAAEAGEQSAEETKQQKGYRLTPHIAAYYETMSS